MSVCHGSPMRTAMELRGLRELHSSTSSESYTCSLFPVLTSYEQVVGCIMESLRAGHVTMEEFDRGIEAVKTHNSSSITRKMSILERTKSFDMSTPIATMHSTPIQTRDRSFSLNMKPVPLSLDEDDIGMRCERKWSMDTASTSLPQSCTNEKQLRLITTIPCSSPTVACAPAPNIPLPPPSPSTFATSRLRGLSQNIGDPVTPSPAQTPLTTPLLLPVTPRQTNPTKTIRFHDISLGDVVGSGSFGVVYRARVNSTGQLIVVKVVPIHSHDESSIAHVEALENELELLQSLQHERIVSYLGHQRVSAKDATQLNTSTIDDTDKLVVFCEYMPGGSLAGTIRQFGAFDEKAIALHTKQILEVCIIYN